jgi:hypothetical protein
MRPDFAARVAISALLLSACAVLAAACAADASTVPASGSSAGFGSSIPDAGADAADAEPTPQSLAFEPSDTLTLEPKATQTLKVAATPAGIFKVRFALLGSGSDGDAALDANEVDTDDLGIAQVTLTAPSMPTTFSVRASVVKVQTQLGVSVSARNYTTLRVLPSYSGKRSVAAWTATVSGGITCADLVGNPPPDGDLSTTAKSGQALDLTKVPVGVDLAVTLRAGHYIGGCANQSALSETDGNQVLVYASDRPLNLAATTVDLSFGPTSPSSALSKLMAGAATQAASALLGSSSDDVSALLDAMHDATPALSRDAFSAARQTYGWDAALGSAFGANASSRVRDPANRWLSAGLTRFYAADAFVGQLGPLESAAQLALTSVTQVPAADAGFPSTFSATWWADSSDTLLLGTELSFIPSQLVSALAILPATIEIPTALTVEAALAASVDCSLVGATLLAHGTTVGSAVYDGCDETCAENACVTALAALWQDAVNSSGSSSASLTVTGTGAALVGDDASITSLTGSWLGQLQLDTDSAPASGPLSAKATTN